MKNIFGIFSLLSLSLLMFSGVRAQSEWNITAEQKSQKLGVAFSDENIDAGEALFKSKACNACHNEMSAVPENTRKLPLAPNLGALDIQKANTDGDFFWKIHNGKGGMPPFAKLTDDECWKIVAYLRSFYPDYEPPAGQTAAKPRAKFKGKVKSLKIEFDRNLGSAVIKVDAVDNEGNPSLANVEVSALLKSSFGFMEINKAKTDENGLAVIECPADIKADTNGMVTFAAAAEGYADTVTVEAQYGEKLVWKNPLDENHLWGVSAKAPLWLKITYLSVVIGVWLTIFWAAFQLIRIYSLRER